MKDQPQFGRGFATSEEQSGELPRKKPKIKIQYEKEVENTNGA